MSIGNEYIKASIADFMIPRFWMIQLTLNVADLLKHITIDLIGTPRNRYPRLLAEAHGFHIPGKTFAQFSIPGEFKQRIGEFIGTPDIDQQGVLSVSEKLAKHWQVAGDNCLP